MTDLITTEAMVAFLQVVMIDLVLAGDNAIVIGLAAAGLPPAQRKQAILVGILAATVLRILFAGVTTQLLQIVGLMFAGGILLLWVCWKMWRELRTSPAEEQPAFLVSYDINADGTIAGRARRKTFGQAALQIVVADVSMSLDNVLAVAGAAKGHVWVLVVGLGVAVVLMAVAASYISGLLTRFPWIAWIGLLLILYVALDMMWRGSLEVACAYVPPAVCGQGLLAALEDLLL
jgi:YjbE family integral membrane protein